MRTDQILTGALVATTLFLGSVGLGNAQGPDAPVPPPAPGSPRSVYTGNHTVERGQTVDEVVVVGGDLTVRGTVTGQAVVVGGRLLLEESGLVEGNATVTGGSIVENGGRVRGEMRVLDTGTEGFDLSAEAGSGDPDVRVVRGPDGEVAVTREVSREIRERSERNERDFFNRGQFRSVRQGFFGLISTVAFGLVLAGIGAVLVFYGRPYLDTVSDTIRGATLRSAGVGLAATFLVVPAFVILIVALAVSIIGIPLILLAVPLYPLAVAAAACLGLLGAAHAIGERTSEQRNKSFDFRYRNAYAYLFTGLGTLIMPLLAADLIQMTGFLGFIGVLLKVVTCIAIWAAMTIGLGAVILSRGGRQRTFASPMDGGFTPDLGFDAPASPGPNV